MNNTVNRILDLMEENNVSGHQLSRRLKLKGNAVTAWKAGTSSSYFKHIGDIADYFDVSTDYLLCKTNKKKPNSSNVKPFLMSKDGQIHHLDKETSNKLSEFLEYIENKSKGR